MRRTPRRHAPDASPIRTMVTDSSRIPASTPTRSRLRASTRVPAPSTPGRRGSAIPAPGERRESGVSAIPVPGSRRASGASAIPTPGKRREPPTSAIPAPGKRRESANSSIPAPGTRRESAASSIPAPGTRRESAVSSIPAPGTRRESAGSSIPTAVTRRESAASAIPAPGVRRESALPSPGTRRESAASNIPVPGSRRESTARRESAIPAPGTRRESAIPTPGRRGSTRVATAEPRTPAASPPSNRVRATLPDRSPPASSSSLALPSPISKNRRTPAGSASGVGQPRVALKASPYSRRTSQGVAVSARGAGAGSTARKLSMAPAADESGVAGAAAAARRTSASPAPRLRRGSLVTPRAQDRVERSRDPSALSKSRAGISALESFRNARRASMEPKPVPEDGENDQLSSLPDRPDASAFPQPSVTPKRTPRSSRVSGRFSDANVNLDNVDRLRDSIGRRRSRGHNSEDVPETPVLRRTSLSTSARKLDMGAAAAKDSQGPRTPLGTINEPNAGTVRPTSTGMAKTPAAAEPAQDLFKLDDDDLSWTNQEVEDLSGR